MEDKEKRSNTTFIVVLILTIMLCTGLVVMSMGAASGSSSSGPNQLGAELPRPVNPTDPSIQQFQSALKAYTDPTATIQERQAALTSMASRIAQWQVAIHSKDSAIPAATQTKLDEAFGKMTAAISSLQAKISDPGTGTQADKDAITKLETDMSNASTEVAQLMQDSGALTGNRAARIVAIAAAVIAQNNDGDPVNGKHPIPYSWGDETISAGMDCSGFISYLFNQTGLLPVGTRTSTDILPGQTNIVDVLKTGTTSAPLTLADINAVGLQPGDILVTSYNGQGHMVMYLGGSFDDPHSVAESTEDGHKSGPQYASITSRLKQASRKLLYILRPKYGA